MGLSDDKMAELWMRHGEQMWRAVYATPIIGIAVFAGWYALMNDGKDGLSVVLLWGGIIIMAVQWTILHRMAQYTNVLRRTLGDKVPSPDAAVLGFAGYRIAEAIPIIIGVLFVVMLFFQR